MQCPRGKAPESTIRATRNGAAKPKEQQAILFGQRSMNLVDVLAVYKTKKKKKITRKRPMQRQPKGAPPRAKPKKEKKNERMKKRRKNVPKRKNKKKSRRKKHKFLIGMQCLGDGCLWRNKASGLHGLEWQLQSGGRGESPFRTTSSLRKTGRDGQVPSFGCQVIGTLTSGMCLVSTV